jgi:hypothetical protein
VRKLACAFLLGSLLTSGGQASGRLHGAALRIVTRFAWNEALMNVDTSDKKQQRSFGIVMAAAFTALGLIRWALHREVVPLVFFGVAVVFLVLGLVLPRVLRPVLWAWLKFSMALNWLMTHFLLTLSFFGMILPVGGVIRLFGNDPLKREWDPNALSYWEEPEEQPAEFDRYLNQF